MEPVVWWLCAHSYTQGTGSMIVGLMLHCLFYSIIWASETSPQTEEKCWLDILGHRIPSERPGSDFSLTPPLLCQDHSQVDLQGPRWKADPQLSFWRCCTTWVYGQMNFPSFVRIFWFLERLVGIFSNIVFLNWGQCPNQERQKGKYRYEYIRVKIM